jgi:hypothetical protein
MNTQVQRLFDTRGFRIGVIAALAVAVLALAAYWFGTGLMADSSASVAPSPLGSSLTNVRESRSEDYVGRLINSSAAARSSSADYASFGLPVFSAVARSSSADYASFGLLVFSAAARSSSTGLSTADYAAKFSIPAAAVSRGESLAILRERWAPFYASLDNALRAAGARPSALSSIGGMVESSAADQYQFAWMGFIAPESVEAKPSAADSYQYEWMGFIAPESVEVKPSAASKWASVAARDDSWARFYIAVNATNAKAAAASPAADQYPWIKPEGIRPAAESGADQLQWLKPEGIKVPGSK